MSLTKDRLVADITDLATTDKTASYLLSATDEAITSTDVSGKKALDVNIAGGVAIEVDLDHTEDSIRLGDGTNLTTVTASGELLVKDTDALVELVKITDAIISDKVQVEVTNSIKITDGTDELAINTDGSINVQTTEAPTTAVVSSAIAVTDTAALLVASPLADRKYLYVQNLTNKDVYLGGSSVTIANGLRVAKGATIDFSNLGETVALWAVGDSGITGNVRVLEVA